MTDVKPYVYIYIQLQTKLHKYFTIIYIYTYMIIYMKIWNNVFTSMQKLDSHKKTELGGIGGGCSPPKKMNMVLKVYILGNMHLVTIWNVC